MSVFTFQKDEEDAPAEEEALEYIGNGKERLLSATSSSSSSSSSKFFQTTRERISIKDIREILTTFPCARTFQVRHRGARTVAVTKDANREEATAQPFALFCDPYRQIPFSLIYLTNPNSPKSTLWRNFIFPLLFILLSWRLLTRLVIESLIAVTEANSSVGKQAWLVIL